MIENVASDWLGIFSRKTLVEAFLHLHRHASLKIEQVAWIEKYLQYNFY